MPLLSYLMTWTADPQRPLLGWMGREYRRGFLPARRSCVSAREPLPVATLCALFVAAEDCAP